MNYACKKRSRLHEAFSLIEIMVVVAIIGFLIALVGPRAMKMLGKAEITATKATLSKIKDAIVEYQTDVGHIPKSDEGGLKALLEKPSKESVAKKWKGPYIEEADLEDKWGNEIIYHTPPEVHRDKFKRFEIISQGPEDFEEDEDIHVGA